MQLNKNLIEQMQIQQIVNSTTIITSSRTCGLDQLWCGSIVVWIVVAWIGLKEGSPRMGASPQTPGFVALARHYAIRQAEPVLNKRHESRQGFEEIITSSRTHGLDQFWLG